MPQAFGFALGFLGAGAGATAFGSLAGFAGGAAFSGTITGMLLRTVSLTVLQSAFTEKPTNPGVRSSVTLAGDTTPEATGVGLFPTAGRRTYPPKTIPNGTKPNVFSVNRIELSGMPGIALLRVLVGGEDAEVDWLATPHADFGQPFGGRFIDDGKVHGWVRFYDGTQTVADPMLVAKLGADPDHPYTAEMVGAGIAYAVVTLKWNPNVFRGDEWNSLQFECDGLPLYDPRSDSSVGGVGDQRWADPSTWVTTRNPKVIEYNVRRGLVPAPGKVWGFRATESDMPLANWIAQMNACDEQVNIGGGLGPRYRCGFEFSFTEEPRAVTGRLNDACSGRVADMGGRWVGRAGPPGPAVATIVEGEGQLLVSEPGALDLFDGTETVVNALSAVFLDPASGWRERETPLFTKPEWVAEDGRVRQARLDLPAVPFPGRAQVLAKEMVEDNRRQRRYVLPARAELAEVDLLETYALTILGDGFDAKDMELTGLVINPQTAAVQVAGREVDPADWTPPTVDTVFTAPVPVVRQELPAQIVPGFDLQPDTITSGGQSRPGLRIVWTTSDDLRDWRGIVYEVRLVATGTVVARGTITDLTTGVHSVDHPATQFAATQYEARVQPYAPGVPVAWSTWRPATTPDVRLASSDLSDALQGDLADGVAGLERATLAARAGWVSDPAGARWSGAGTLDPAHWATEDAAGVLSQVAGVAGTGIRIAVPSGGGRSTALLPVLTGADPKATMATVTLDVTFDAGDPFVPAVAVEWFTGAQWLPGELVTDGWGPQLLTGAVGVYDFANVATLWQDDAGTVPAVVDQPVARVTDLAGVRTLKQTAAAQRPTLRLAAGRLALQWDGGDVLFADNSAWGTDAVTVAVAYLKETQTTGSVVNWGSNPVSVNGTWEVQSSGSGALGDVFSTRGTVRVPLFSNSPAVPVAQILTMTADISTPVVTARRNGVQVATSAASQGTGNYSTALLRVGSRSDGSQRLDAHVYGMALFDRVLDAGEIAQVEQWLSRRASPAGTFSALGITVAAGVRQAHSWTVRRPATADNTTPPRLRLTAANPLITTAQTLTIHRLDVRGTTQAEVDARQALLDAAAAADAAAGALAQAPIVVDSLPGTGDFEGQFAYLRSDDKLYRWTGVAWSKAVDGADLIADSVIAGKVAAGVIGARELAAGAVTASKVLITDQTNLVPDDQLQDADAWDNSANFDVIPVTTAGAAANSLGEVRYVGALPVSSAVFSSGGDFTVEPGEELLCSAQIGRINGTSYTARAAIRWSNIANTVTVTSTIGSAITTTNPLPQAVSGIVTVPTSPADLRRGRFRWIVDAADGNVRFFAPVVRRRFGGELIVDGGIKAQQADLVSLGAATAWVGTLTVGDTAITESDQESYGSVTLTIGGTTSVTVAQDVTIDGPTTRADVRLSFAMGAFTGSPTWTVNIESPIGTVRKSLSGNTKQEFVNIASEITLAAGPRTVIYRFSITGASGSVTFNAREGFVGQFKR